MSAACKASSDPQAVQLLYQNILDHNNDWQADRNVALALRRSMYNPASSCGIYENDDKCGSFWCKMPVADGGRDSKRAASAKYDFAIQANVVCGDQGTARFSVVPSNVRTGSNFGLTNLVTTLWEAWRSGRFRPHTRELVRHTDGGGDNMSYLTHVVHYLLVYLGIFEEITWFRFEAGHSHTEISDRLFGVLKRLFKSETAARVARTATFSELFAKIDQDLKKCPEARLFEFDLANWDFEEWLKDMNATSPCGVSTTRGMFEGKLARHTFDMVWRYTYTESLWQHGGVKVTYKPRLSMTPGENDAEWSPVAEKTRPPANGVGPPVAVCVPLSPPRLPTAPQPLRLCQTLHQQ